MSHGYSRDIPQFSSQENIFDPVELNTGNSPPSPTDDDSRTSLSLSSSSQKPKAGAAAMTTSVIDSIKPWMKATFKSTKQQLMEKLGKTSRTVDVELEGKIESLRDTQKKYENILRLTRALSSHFNNVIQTQKLLSDSFSELAQKSPELQTEFTYNSEAQKTLAKYGDKLLGALNFFTSSLNTLCNKTIEDTLQTIKSFETARLAYDASRAELEALQATPRTSVNASKLVEAQREFEEHKHRYDQLRADVDIKMKFLDENRLKVMQKQLYLFHKATASYFSGNQEALEGTLKQFNIKMPAPNAEKPSWLEY